MKYILSILICTFFYQIGVHAQEKTYILDTKKDLILSGVGIGLNVLALSINTEGPTLEGIDGLNENDLWSLDRSAIRNSSQTAVTMSDVILYSALSVPLAIYSDKKCRHEGLAIGIMGMEAFLLTNGLTVITKKVVERYRPFVYNPNVPIQEKLSSGARLSFFSGHTSMTTAMSFFATKVVTDLYPDMRHKWLAWTIGATTPALIGYLRYEGGKHFLTDVITGYAVGALIGYFVPASHLNKKLNVGISFAGTLDFRYTF